MNVVLFEDKPYLALNRAGFDILVGGFTLFDAVTKVFGKPYFSVRRDVEEVTVEKYGKRVMKNVKNAIFINASFPPSIKLLKQLKTMLKDRTAVYDNNKRIIALSGVSNLKTTPAFAKKKMDIELPSLWQLPSLSCEILEDNLKYLKSGKFKKSKTAVFHGKVIVGKGAEISDYAVIHGPCFIGENSKINEHALIKNSVIGSNCKIGGEVTCSLIQDYSNKQHLGFVGHSYLGSWVNLGAGTTTSNMKNTYGTVKFLGKDTKIQFLGCIMQDHSKSAVNTTILTGKSIGYNSHLYGFISSDVPSFTHYAKSLGDIAEVELDSAIRTAKRMMERRGVKQTKADIALMKHLFKTPRKGVKKKKLSLK